MDLYCLKPLRSGRIICHHKMIKLILWGAGKKIVSSLLPLVSFPWPEETSRSSSPSHEGDDNPLGPTGKTHGRNPGPCCYREPRSLLPPCTTRLERNKSDLSRSVLGPLCHSSSLIQAGLW